MIYRGYSEAELVANRSSLLLHGANEADRRLWAEEAARNFEAEGPLRVAHTGDELKASLERPHGAVYVPDLGAISYEAQRHLVWVLREREERPKVIVGLNGTPDQERDNARLTTELHYALQLAHVNLDAPGLKDVLKTRRAKALARAQKKGGSAAPVAARTPARKSKPAAKPKAKAAKAKPKAVRKAAPAPKKKLKAAARRRR